MIHELVVTSAPRGLQAGRSGFTTVLRTRGIHPDLAARLEAASAYRHVHPQGDPRNPVIYCYTARQSAVGEAWVMSRIGDAGTDYTGRSNKIAHHVALQAADLATVSASNPAAVMAALAAAGGLLVRWNGEPREQPAAPVLPLPPSSPGACQRWAAVAGDAGWAGVIVERALNREPTWVIAPPNCDLLELYAEALALVGPGQRWQIPFTTYSLRGDEGRWLGTTAGSPEAVAAEGQNRILVVNLTRRGPAAGTGPYVQAARGLAPVPWQRQAAPAVVARPGAATANTPGGIGSGPATTVASGKPGPVSLGLPPMPRSLRGPNAGDDGDWEEIPIDRPRTGRLALLASIAALLLVGIGVGAYVYLTKTVSGPGQTEIGNENRNPPLGTPIAQDNPPVGTSPPDAPQSDKLVTAASSTTVSSPSPVADGPSTPESTPHEATAVVSPPATPIEEPAAPTRADIEAKANSDFDELSRELVSRGHLPRAGLQADDFTNGTPFTARRGVLGDVGDAEIDVALPQELFEVRSGVRYRLHAVVEATSGTAAGSWVVRAVPGPPAAPDLPPESAAKTYELGRIRRDGRELVVEMDAQDTPPDSLEAATIATVREALVTAAVKITKRNDAARTVCVQCGTPAESRSVSMPKFFFEPSLDSASHKAKKNSGWKIDVPRSPWPVRLRLKPAAAGVHGKVVEGGADPAVDGRSPGDPAVAIRWSAQPDAEPFLETKLGLGAADGSGASELRVLAATPLGPWGSYRRFAFIHLSAQDSSEFRGVRETKVFKAFDLDGVPTNSIEKLVRAVAQRENLKPPAANAVAKLLPRNKKAPLVGDEPSPADGTWRRWCRQALAISKVYQDWLQKDDPPPSPPPKDAKPEVVKKYTDDFSKWESRIAPRMREISEADLTTVRAKLEQDSPQALLLCKLIDEITELAREKRETLALIESLGAGDVTLEGEVVVEFPSLQTRSVLVRFADAPAGASTDEERHGGEAESRASVASRHDRATRPLLPTARPRRYGSLEERPPRGERSFTSGDSLSTST